jgi:hypothetical protein
MHIKKWRHFSSSTCAYSVSIAWMETLHAPNPYFSNIFSTICSLFFVGFMGGSVSKILCCEGSICALWEEAEEVREGGEGGPGSGDGREEGSMGREKGRRNKRRG